MKTPSGKSRLVKNLLLPLACSAILCLLGTGCAGVTYKPIQSEKEDANSWTTGLRYFDSSPYLLMQRDKEKKGWTAQMLYLPDQTKKYQAKPYTFLAANNTSFAFSNAILTDASSDADASAVAAAIIKAAEAVGETIIKMTAFDAAHLPPKEQPKTLGDLLANSDVALFKIVRVQVAETVCPTSTTNWVWGIVGGSAGSN